MSESPKRRSAIFRTGKVDNIFKRFMKSKVDQKNAKENINAFLKNYYFAISRWKRNSDTALKDRGIRSGSLC